MGKKTVHMWMMNYYMPLYCFVNFTISDVYGFGADLSLLLGSTSDTHVHMLWCRYSIDSGNVQQLSCLIFMVFLEYIFKCWKETCEESWIKYFLFPTCVFDFLRKTLGDDHIHILMCMVVKMHVITPITLWTFGLFTFKCKVIFWSFEYHS